jgi:hypothetical protein
LLKPGPRVRHAPPPPTRWRCETSFRPSISLLWAVARQLPTPPVLSCAVASQRTHMGMVTCSCVVSALPLICRAHQPSPLRYQICWPVWTTHNAVTKGSSSAHVQLASKNSPPEPAHGPTLFRSSSVALPDEASRKLPYLALQNRSSQNLRLLGRTCD